MRRVLGGEGLARLERVEIRVVPVRRRRRSGLGLQMGQGGSRGAVAEGRGGARRGAEGRGGAWGEAARGAEGP